MEKVIIKDIELQKASEEGMDAFVDVFVKHTLDLVGGELTAETMPRLSADQITLLGYNILRDEVMNGGYIQLIHNGYGGFIFMNPFARAMKEWGLVELARHIRKKNIAIVLRLTVMTTSLWPYLNRCPSLTILMTILWSTKNNGQLR